MELTDGSLLRRRAGDLDAVVAACQDPEIARWILRVPSPYTEQHARDFITWSQQCRDGTAELTFAITAAR